MSVSGHGPVVGALSTKFPRQTRAATAIFACRWQICNGTDAAMVAKLVYQGRKSSCSLPFIPVPPPVPLAPPPPPRISWSPPLTLPPSHSLVNLVHSLFLIDVGSMDMPNVDMILGPIVLAVVANVSSVSLRHCFALDVSVS